MKYTIKRFCAAGAAGMLASLVAGAGATGEAGAQTIIIPPANTTTSVTAISGTGWPNADKNCFVGSWSRVKNNCTTTKTFLLPLPVIASQIYTSSPSILRVNGRVYSGSTSATRVNCKAMVITKSNGARFSSTLHSGDGTDTATKAYRSLGDWVGDLGFYPGTAIRAYIGNEDTAHLDCQVPAGAGVVSALASVE